MARRKQFSEAVRGTSPWLSRPMQSWEPCFHPRGWAPRPMRTQTGLNRSACTATQPFEREDGGRQRRIGRRTCSLYFFRR
jgi:hypothetical protein